MKKHIILGFFVILCGKGEGMMIDRYQIMSEGLSSLYHHHQSDAEKQYIKNIAWNVVNADCEKAKQVFEEYKQKIKDTYCCNGDDEDYKDYKEFLDKLDAFNDMDGILYSIVHRYYNGCYIHFDDANYVNIIKSIILICMKSALEDNNYYNIVNCFNWFLRQKKSGDIFTSSEEIINKHRFVISSAINYINMGGE